MPNSTAVVSLDKKDYISRLPQAIIHHILSQLTTREVAQTSVLSKTWKSLWSSFPYLDFDQDRFPRASGFKEFVDHSLKGHQESGSDILKFWLSVTSEIEALDIHNWVSLVTERNVKEFHLRIKSDQGGKPYMLPPQNMCTAKTITVLKLYGCDVKFCSVIKLPHLQILSLENVFLDKRTIGIFINSCPSMKDLRLVKCNGLKLLIVANLHQLQRVEVGFCLGLEKVEIRVSSLQTLLLYENMRYTYRPNQNPYYPDVLVCDPYPLVLKIDSRAYEMLMELQLCNFCIEDGIFQDLMFGLSNLECLILDGVLKPQNVRILSEKLKRLVFKNCGFLTCDFRAPHLSSLEYVSNRMLFYPVETYDVQEYIFDDCWGYFQTERDQKILWFESMKEFLMNSKDAGKGTKMVLYLRWPAYTFVLEDWTLITQLPFEAVHDVWPCGIHISNMSFTDLAECLIRHYNFRKRLLVISSSDSELYEVLKEKPNCCWKSTFTMEKAVFERNTTPKSWDPTSIKNNFSGENYHKCPFFGALLEVGSKTMQGTVLELQQTS